MIRLEQGKRYFTREGTMTEPLIYDINIPGRGYVFKDARTNKTWTEKGEIYRGETNRFDIVREFTDFEYSLDPKIYNTGTGNQLVSMEGGRD